MELPYKSARFVVIFVCLFCFHLGRICDLYFRQKYWKSFYSYDRNILFGYDVIRGIQEATSISFFSFCGVSKWESKENTLHCWVVDQSTGFLLACWSHLNILIAEKLGKRVNKSEKFDTRITMTTIS